MDSFTSRIKQIEKVLLAQQAALIPTAAKAHSLLVHLVCGSQEGASEEQRREAAAAEAELQAIRESGCTSVPGGKWMVFSW